jgi:uncharacterized protein (DUF2062 family)
MTFRPKIKKNSLKRFLRFIFLKLFRVNDSPQRVALGFGVGVFTGIMPGVGPIAALFLASLVKVNKASALLGSLLTNTWLSIFIFMLSVKTGAALLGLHWQEVQGSWKTFLADFHWMNLFKLSILNIIMPVFLGYLIVALFSGILGYLTILPLLKFLKALKLKKRKASHSA